MSAWLTSVMSGLTSKPDAPPIRCQHREDSTDGKAERVCTKRPGHDGSHAMSSWYLKEAM